MTCQLILTLIVGPQYEDLDIGMNPFHFQYLISNSLYCLLYNSTIFIWRIWYWVN